MKCPKCGYTSFDDLDSCRKCGIDLTDHKHRFGLGDLLFAARRPAESAEADATRTSEAGPLTDEELPAETGDGTAFGFDLLEGEDASDEAPATASRPDSEERPAPVAETAGGDFFAEESDGFGPPLPAEDLEDQEDDLGADLEDDFTFADFDDEDPFAADPTALTDEPEAQPAAQRRPLHPEPPEGPDPFEQGGSSPDGRSPLADDDRLPPVGDAEPSWPDPDPAAWTLPGQDSIPPLEDIRAPEPAPLPTFGQQEASPTWAPEPPATSATGEFPEESAATATAEPAAADQTETAPESAAPAPLITRLAASLADLLVLAALYLLFLVVGDHLLHPGGGLLPDPQSLLILATPYFLLFFITGFGYFTLFHLLLGQTPGKMLFGLGIESGRGGSLGPGQAFLRSVGGLAALTAGGLGFLPSLFDPQGRGWNDRLADTRVVSWRSAASATTTSDQATSEG